MMGSPETENGRFEAEGPCHEVTVPDFYMGKFPVTNREYSRFLEENPEKEEPDYWSDRQFNQPNHPVVGVSFADAGAYAQWAGLQLPSEAQWEYACRAGTQTRYYTGNDESDLAGAGWYKGNSNERLCPVGQKAPNNFGLYDMHGNVFEWVADQFHKNYERAPNDGSPWLGMDDDAGRVVRGGSWSYSARFCRAAYRHACHPGYRSVGLGLRLALPGQHR